MIRRAMLACCLTLPMLVQSTPAASAATGYFGSGPWAAIVDAANRTTSTQRCGASVNKTIGMALAMVWGESTGKNMSLVPAPLNVSRHDYKTAFHQGETYKRAYWHPGTGYSHIDDANTEVGDKMGIVRFQGIGYARSLVKLINMRYCKYGNTSDGWPSKWVWSIWFGCGAYGASCVSYFKQIYSPGTNSLNINRSTAISTNGGAVAKSCSLPHNPNVYFTCMYVDPARAEGYKSYFTLYPEGSPTTSTATKSRYADWSPLTRPFYIWESKNSAGVWFENRTWLRANTGYNKHITATRQFGRGSRAGLAWSTTRLCFRMFDEYDGYYASCPAA